jgi:hypothetical protein
MIIRKSHNDANRTGGTMNKLFGVLIGILACTSVAADVNDFRCLKSTGVKTPLRLQFVFQTDKPDMGYVIYQNGSGPIAVKKLKEREMREVPGGRPSVFEAQWEEITPDGTGGKYIVVSQGALIYEFRYIRKKDGKIFKFEEDIEVSNEDRCEWNKK